ncbi:MAG: macro domain-containing protein [Candidatus Limnocylindria bacterium]
MAGPIEIDVWQGEIAELELDALVVAANESLFMTAGPAASVKRHGGLEIEHAAVDQGPIAPGQAVATTAGTLAATYVIHAVAVGHDLRADAEILRAAIDAALAYAEPLQLRRMAFALIGAERGSFPADEAAEQLVLALTRHGEQRDRPELVVIAAANPVEFRAASDALERQQTRVP